MNRVVAAIASAAVFGPLIVWALSSVASVFTHLGAALQVLPR